jgi:hypothetical protein
MNSTQLAPNTETELNTSSNLSFFCYVTLSEKEQIILEREKIDGDWVNGVFVGTNTGIMEKFRLEQLHYSGYGDGLLNRATHSVDSGVYLDRITVRGFRKDGGLKFRDTQLYGASPAVAEMLPQIPDHYHDYARQEFAKEAIKLQTQLKELIKAGVII